MRFLSVLTVAFFASPSLFAAEFPKFKTQEIDTGLKIGYAVLTTDINGDKKPDIVVVDQHKVVWYENPTWKKRIILDGKSKPDNVCAAAVDIDGDGLPEIVLGSAWKPADTTTPGQLSWLKRGKSLDEEWTMHELPCDEPTVHRVQVADLDGDGIQEIICVPLHGKGATAKGNWTDGRPVRIIALRLLEKGPEKKENWYTQVLSEELHVCHNFTVDAVEKGKRQTASVVVASYEGIHLVTRENRTWVTKKLHEGNQANPKGSRGASEYKNGFTIRAVGATIEPWHGNQVVVYSNSLDKGKPWNRHVIDEQLRWGHAVWFADLDGDGVDELIIGVRDDPNPKAGDKFTERRGVRIYKATDVDRKKWERMMLDEGGVAVEDLCAADLNGDGKIDIIAVGRQTGNCKIYWNQGK